MRPPAPRAYFNQDNHARGETMSLVPISPELRRDIRVAMASPFRFERHERFAMQKLLQYGQVNDVAEAVYVEAAKRALRRQCAEKRFGRGDRRAFGQDEVDSDQAGAERQ